MAPVKVFDAKNPSYWHRSLTTAKIVRACEADDYTGFCVKCGTERENTEPDAREYTCPVGCGPFVFGAEELLIMCDGER